MKTAPPPPGLFSTDIGLSIALVSVNTLAIVRAVISQPPPAPDGAMILSAFTGYEDAVWFAPLPHAANETANMLIDVTFKDAVMTFFIK
ncbi:hypothetical protein GCM10008018_46940 [Paenibacillus marchantiophytorum]|uniref:Uncharacterized protein n=1 Tax=Paenibacillus marchantiophytorum TaxID=1619310 RepID=A0ABQ1EZW0_9BACL|nr:hypothetical protein GCM10008018_46940 [Paenibacillus marchantiophytorum]